MTQPTLILEEAIRPREMGNTLHVEPAEKVSELLFLCLCPTGGDVATDGDCMYLTRESAVKLRDFIDEHLKRTAPQPGAKP
jgi:hypothetical protein